MADKRVVTCMGCPKSCQVSVNLERDTILHIKGYRCGKGKVYAEKEIKNPVRVVTSTVCIQNGTQNRLPVRTREGIPMTMMLDCIRQLRAVEVRAPVKSGDVILKDFNGTGIEIVASKDVGEAFHR